MIVGCYDLQLYCDGIGCQTLIGCVTPSYFVDEAARGEFTGRTEADCLRQAKAAGWTLYRRRVACRCARCTKLGNKTRLP